MLIRSNSGVQKLVIPDKKKRSYKFQLFKKIKSKTEKTTQEPLISETFETPVKQDKLKTTYKFQPLSEKQSIVDKSKNPRESRLFVPELINEALKKLQIALTVDKVDKPKQDTQKVLTNRNKNLKTKLRRVRDLGMKKKITVTHFFNLPTSYMRKNL